MDTQDTRRSAEHFLALIKASHRGKFKVYIGMSAGVGKTYRMLQEAHQLLDAGVDVQIGYIRKEMPPTKLTSSRAGFQIRLVKTPTDIESVPLMVHDFPALRKTFCT